MTSVANYFKDGANTWAAITINAEGKTNGSYHDAYGPIAKIAEVTVAGTYNTTYTYDPAGNLAYIANHTVNRIAFVYERLRRELTMSEGTRRHRDGGSFMHATDIISDGPSLTKG